MLLALLLASVQPPRCNAEGYCLRRDGSGVRDWEPCEAQAEGAVRGFDCRNHIPEGAICLPSKNDPRVFECAIRNGHAHQRND